MFLGSPTLSERNFLGGDLGHHKVGRIAGGIFFGFRIDFFCPASFGLGLGRGFSGVVFNVGRNFPLGSKVRGIFCTSWIRRDRRTHRSNAGPLQYIFIHKLALSSERNRPRIGQIPKNSQCCKISLSFLFGNHHYYACSLYYVYSDS